MTESRYRSEAPVFKVDGDVKGDLARDLLYLEVEETTEGLRTMSARFSNLGEHEGDEVQQLYYFDGAILDFGKKVEVSIGPSADSRIIFAGLLSGLEARFDEGQEPEVVAFAEDKLMKLRMTRRSKTYKKMSDAEIAADIADAHGLSADCDATGPTYDVVQQWNQSDLAFLRERARLVRAEIWVEDDKLLFKSRGSRTGTELTLMQGIDLLSVQIRADLAHQRTSVKVSGYDAQARDVIDEEATGDAIQAEIAGGRTGPDVLKQAFGERASYRVRQAPLTGDEARQWAKNEMLRRARGFVHVLGTARGMPDMIVGSKLTLGRVGGPFNGDGYYVTRVCHTYDLSNGHRTLFEAERPTVSTNA
jgi:phage protein D